jgi:hypothetical protein
MCIRLNEDDSGSRNAFHGLRAKYAGTEDELGEYASEKKVADYTCSTRLQSI